MIVWNKPLTLRTALTLRSSNRVRYSAYFLTSVCEACEAREACLL